MTVGNFHRQIVEIHSTQLSALLFMLGLFVAVPAAALIETEIEAVNIQPAIVEQGYGQVVFVRVTSNGTQGGTFVPPSGVIDVDNGYDSCQIVLPDYSCVMIHSHVGQQMVFARYSGDATYAPSLSEASEVSVIRRQLPELVSRNDGLGTGVSTGYSDGRPAAISRNGRYVALTSDERYQIPDPYFAPSALLFDMERLQLSRVSLTDDGLAADQPSKAWAVSETGRFVLFESTASNLSPPTAQGLYRRDREADQTRLVSVNNDGIAANGVSTEGATSGNGRWVVFSSTATNLDAIDTNDRSDIYLRDVDAGLTELISLGVGGEPSNGRSFAPKISDDGRFVAFHSSATNLVADDSNGTTDVFLFDRHLGTTARLSETSGGVGGDGSSVNATISADGSRVSFLSWASNLVIGDTNLLPDAFLWDMATPSSLRRMSTNSANQQLLGNTTQAAISPDGQHLAFITDAPEYVDGLKEGTFVCLSKSLSTDMVSIESVDPQEEPLGGVTSFCAHANDDDRTLLGAEWSTSKYGAGYWTESYITDKQTGALTLASPTTIGSFGNLTSFGVDVSDDGMEVLYLSVASNLMPDDAFDDVDLDAFVRDRRKKQTIAISDDDEHTEVFQAAISGDGDVVTFTSDNRIFAKDLNTGEIVRVDVDNNGQPADHSVVSESSQDGTLIVFTTDSALVADDQNEQRDVYVRDLISSHTSRVSVDSDGNEGDGASIYPTVSADGRFVAFLSLAVLDPLDVDDTYSVYLHDRISGQTHVVGQGGSIGQPAISANGQFVIYHASFSGVFVYDRDTGQTTREDIAWDGSFPDSAGWRASISGDGRYVTFISNATDLVPDGDDFYGIYLRDRDSGEIVNLMAEVTVSDPGSLEAKVSADGRWVAVAANAPLVASRTTAFTDAYVFANSLNDDVFNDGFD